MLRFQGLCLMDSGVKKSNSVGVGNGVLLHVKGTKRPNLRDETRLLPSPI